MKRIDGYILGGILLVAGGALLFMQNLGLLGGTEAVWAILFALGGVACAAAYVQDRAKWWALIAAGALLAIAAPLALTAAGDQGEAIGGPAFLAILGLGFAAVYLDQRRAHWWALIPAGVILTLAAVAALGATPLAEAGGAVFFFGLALTFFGVALLPDGGRRRDWAFYPAAACAGLGMVVVASTTPPFSIVAAVALILAGVYLLYRTRHTVRP